jgi:hypothetical protein
MPDTYSDSILQNLLTKQYNISSSIIDPETPQNRKISKKKTSLQRSIQFLGWE